MVVRVKCEGEWNSIVILFYTTAWLAQLVERQSAVWEVKGSGFRATDRINIQGLKITEENVLPL